MPANLWSMRDVVVNIGVVAVFILVAVHRKRPTAALASLWHLVELLVGLNVAATLQKRIVG